MSSTALVPKDERETTVSESASEDRLQRIRDTAYDLWEKAGRPEGQDHDFWLEAEKVVDGEADGEAAGGTADDDLIDRESDDSFPASDPPSFNP